MGALHPTVVKFIGSSASEHRKHFWTRFWVRTPRCVVVCTIPRHNDTITTPPKIKTPYMPKNTEFSRCVAAPPITTTTTTITHI